VLDAQLFLQPRLSAYLTGNQGMMHTITLRVQHVGRLFSFGLTE
jgi:hypothetical protein